MKNNDWVSASEVGQVMFCPHSLELKYKGAEVSESAHHRRAKGNFEHEQFNQRIKHAAQANRDQRCFIASQVYGENDPRTEQLRTWRDEVLMQTPIGRWMIRLYYALSPGLVKVCQKVEWMNSLSRVLLDCLRRWVS